MKTKTTYRPSVFGLLALTATALGFLAPPAGADVICRDSDMSFLNYARADGSASDSFTYTVKSGPATVLAVLYEGHQPGAPTFPTITWTPVSGPTVTLLAAASWFSDPNSVGRAKSMIAYAVLGDVATDISGTVGFTFSGGQYSVAMRAVTLGGVSQDQPVGTHTHVSATDTTSLLTVPVYNVYSGAMVLASYASLGSYADWVPPTQLLGQARVSAQSGSVYAAWANAADSGGVTIIAGSQSSTQQRVLTVAEFQPVQAPEPASLAVLCVGGMMLLGRRRR